MQVGILVVPGAMKLRSSDAQKQHWKLVLHRQPIQGPKSVGIQSSRVGAFLMCDRDYGVPGSSPIHACLCGPIGDGTVHSVDRVSQSPFLPAALYRALLCAIPNQTGLGA